jgi:hypothetical protein
MRTLLLLLFLANLILSLGSWLILPDPAAIHFGRGGVPDSWAPPYAQALLFLILELPLFLLFYFGPERIPRLSPRWLSLPNRQYWLAEENRGHLRGILAQYWTEFGVGIFVFLFLVGLLSLEANLAEPVRLNEALFFPVFGLFMLYTLVWCVRFVLALRVPRGEGGGREQG